MPRAKKPAGTAVDSRNGERASLPAVPLRRFALPRRSDGLDYDLRTRRMWKALFDDQALSSVLSPVDRELVIRWAQAVDDYIKALASAREAPISKGSMGQEVESPHFKIAAQAMSVIEKCEAQIGIGALNRARLGIAILAERASLADLAARFDGGGIGDEPDPRLG
jgi:P27 family predicted phage terminase small subunit